MRVLTGEPLDAVEGVSLNARGWPLWLRAFEVHIKSGSSGRFVHKDSRVRGGDNLANSDKEIPKLQTYYLPAGFGALPSCSRDRVRLILTLLNTLRYFYLKAELNVGTLVTPYGGCPLDVTEREDLTIRS